MRNQRKPQTTQDILSNAGGALDHIVSHVKNLKALSKILDDLLPADLRPHCKLANYERGKLTIAVDSGAIAAKWHYLKPQLLSLLRKDRTFAGTATIDVAVKPDFFEQSPTLPEVEHKTFSADVTQQLISLISETEDPKLKEKLEGLLKHSS